LGIGMEAMGIDFLGVGGSEKVKIHSQSSLIILKVIYFGG